MKVSKLSELKEVVPPGHYHVVAKPLANRDNVGATQFAVMYNLCEPNGYADPHAHAGIESAYYIVSGRAAVTIDKETQEVGPGTLVFIPAGASHGFKVVGGKPLELLAVAGPRPLK